MSLELCTLKASITSQVVTIAGDRRRVEVEMRFLNCISALMNSIGEMTPNPCNIPASAIPKRQVSLRRKVGVQFCINSSLSRG